MWFNWFVVKKRREKNMSFSMPENTQLYTTNCIFSLWSTSPFSISSTLFFLSLFAEITNLYLYWLLLKSEAKIVFQCRRLRFFRCNNKYLFFRSVECWFLMGHLNLECKLISRFLPSIFIKIDWKINFKTNCSPTGLILFKLYHFYY